MNQVHRRGGFSDRNKIKEENTIIQLNRFDKVTRIKIQNAISNWYLTMYNNAYYRTPEIQEFMRYILGEVYAKPVDTRYDIDDDEFFCIIGETLQQGSYDDVLTLVEAIVQYWDDELRSTDPYGYARQNGNDTIFDCFNNILKQEFVGYRFLNGIIVPISDDVEVKEISQAINNPYEIVSDHLHKASVHLSNRENPDYENSIKESISAIEALCEILTGLKGREATLGNMLKKLESNGVVVHGGLKSAFNTLYGYTSDANGIRHAGDIGGPASTFEEAKFMLVSCSAFVNYLLGVWSN